MALTCAAKETGLYTVPKGLESTWNFRLLNCAEMLSAKQDPKKASFLV